MDQKGIRQAIIYGLTPNRLGLCGPQEKHELLYQWLIKPEKVSLAEVIRTLESFQGAYPYYQLIARENRLRDPFAPEVVEAYWLGNKLLDNVSLGNFKKMIADKLEKAQFSVPPEAKPHHSFHVLCLRSGLPYELKYLDICRVGWGKILEIEGSQALVKYQPLKEKDGRFFLASPARKTLVFDKKVVPELHTGETVSFHWGQVCERLTKGQEKALVYYTSQSLDLVNR